ncbi:MAG TPA: universal stress protein [Chthonomonadaceae bacterium]|nr:universal stress protein [Chthonomonadaceae bacterium]
MFQKILICADGSDQALNAVRTAAEIAQKFGSEIFVVNVFSPSTVPVPFVGVPEAMVMAEADMAEYARQVQTAVEKSVAEILTAANVPYQTIREIGHPIDRIVAAAEREEADLIIMGSRGMGGWKSYLLGSVSDGVLHHAHCPVLIVR